MAYQNPSYSFLHAAADAGVANVVPQTGAATGYPEDNLIDYRPSSLFRFASGGVDRTVDIDRGAGTLEAVDRLIIPVGHNLAASTSTIAKSSPDDVDWGNTLVSWNQSNATVPAGIIDKSFTSTDDRYLRFSVRTPGSQWEYGQLVFTRKRTPSVGIDPRWTANKVSSTLKVPFPSREASLSTAPDRWFYRVPYNRIDGTDLTIFDDLFEETGSGLVPFYFDPPDDGDDPILMSIQGEPVRRQDHPSPSGAGGATYRIEFDMLEQSG